MTITSPHKRGNAAFSGGGRYLIPLAVFTWVATQLCEHNTGLHVSSSIYCKPLMGLSFHTLTLVPAERCTACIVKYVVLNRKTLVCKLQTTGGIFWASTMTHWHVCSPDLQLTAYSLLSPLTAAFLLLYFRSSKTVSTIGFQNPALQMFLSISSYKLL